MPGPAAPLFLAVLGLGVLFAASRPKTASAAPGESKGKSPADLTDPEGLPPELKGQFDAVMQSLQSGVTTAGVQAATQLAGRLREAGYTKLAAMVDGVVFDARKQLPPLPPDQGIPATPGVPQDLLDRLNQAIATERDPEKLRAILAALQAHPAAGEPQMQMAIQMLKALIIQVEAASEQNDALEKIDRITSPGQPQPPTAAPPAQRPPGPPPEGESRSPGQPQPPAYKAAPAIPMPPELPIYSAQPVKSPVPEPLPGLKIPAKPMPQPLPQPKSPTSTAAEGVALNMLQLEKSHGLPKAKGKEDVVLLKRFQRMAGMAEDGKAGPGVLLALAKYVGSLPHVWYWPKSATKANVVKYRADLNAEAQRAQAAGDVLRATQLVASASRENGEGGIVGVSPPKASVVVPAPKPAAPPTSAKPPVLSTPALPVPVERGAPVSTVLVPDPDSLAGKTATMLYQSGTGPASNISLLVQYKKSVGLDDTRLYGPGTGKSLMTRGIVPPTPWDWPSKDTLKSKKDYKANLTYMSTKDKARKTQWLAAAAQVV